MKRIQANVFIVMVGMMFCSTVAMAEGQSLNFGVFIPADGSSMFGSYNNRYDTTPSSSTTNITATFTSGSGNVSFAGRSGEGNTFSCVVTPSSSFYQLAYDVAMNIEHGWMQITRNSATNHCNFLVFQKNSAVQD